MVEMNAENFRRDLESLINRHSMENGCDTPDFILANYLAACLKTFDAAVVHRDRWYGRHPKSASAPTLKRRKTPREVMRAEE
jgi:hypothetical protein